MGNATRSWYTVSVVYDFMTAEDVRAAKDVVAFLRGAGVDVFFQDDCVGRKLHEVGREAATRERVVVLVTPESLRSNHVRFQLRLALDHADVLEDDTTIVPVVVTTTSPFDLVAHMEPDDPCLNALRDRVPFLWPRIQETRQAERFLSSFRKGSP